MVLSPLSILKTLTALSLVLSGGATAAATNLRDEASQPHQHRQLATAANKTPPAPFPFIAAEAPDYNNKVIGAMLRQSMHLRAPSDGYAVFSWDETVMAGKLMDNIMYHQLETINFRIPPSRFFELLMLNYHTGATDECMPEGPHTPIGQDEQGNVYTLFQMTSNLFGAYQWLYSNYISQTFNYIDYDFPVQPQGLFDLNQRQSFVEYGVFRQGLFFMLENFQRIAKEHPGSECGKQLPALLQARLLTGMHESEIRLLTRDALNRALTTEIRTEAIPPTPQPFKSSIRLGLRTYNGQKSMIRALRLHHVDIYLMADIPHVVLDEVATMPALGFRFAKEKIFGTKYLWDAAGKFTAQFTNEYPTPIASKRYLSHLFLYPKHNGRAPLFVSGATDEDCEMLRMAEDNGIAHMVNTASTSNPGSCLQHLKDLACAYYGQTEGSTNTWYLLQGINNQWGTWVPSGFSSINGGEYAAGANYDCSGYNFKQ